MSANSRAKCNQDAEGMMKVIGDKKTDRLLGVHMIAPVRDDHRRERSVLFRQTITLRGKELFVGRPAPIVNACFALCHPATTASESLMFNCLGCPTDLTDGRRAHQRSGAGT